MRKDYLSFRQASYNRLPTSNEITQELSLRKETESLKKRKELLHSNLMEKRMQEINVPLNSNLQFQTSISSMTTISDFIHQSYSNSSDKLDFITHLLHSNSSILNYTQPITDNILIEEGLILLSLYFDNNTNLSTKDANFFFEKIFFCLTDKLTSKKSSLTIKHEISRILTNITNNDNLCRKYSQAFCDQLFLFNLNKYFSYQLDDSIDKKLLANVILIISNIMSENSSNYKSVIEQILFLPTLHNILNSSITNSWAKFSEMTIENSTLLENSLFLLYNFFFYMDNNRMIDYFQFQTMTIKLLQKSYHESNQKMFLLFLEIAVLFTKSKDVIKALFVNNGESNIGLFPVLFHLINNINSIPTAINSIRLIRNVYRSGYVTVNKALIDMNIEEVVFKNIYLWNNEDVLSVYLDLLALLIKKKEEKTKEKLTQYKDVINALSNVFNKAQVITTKVEVMKAMRAIINMNNNDVFEYFFIGVFWKGLLYWLKENNKCNNKNAPLIYRILKLIDEMMMNCPNDFNQNNAIKIELENQGVNSVIERLIESTFSQISEVSRIIYNRYWGVSDRIYEFENYLAMID